MKKALIILLIFSFCVTDQKNFPDLNIGTGLEQKVVVQSTA